MVKNYILMYTKRDDGETGYVSWLEFYTDSIHILSTYEIHQRDLFKGELMRFTKERALEIASSNRKCQGMFIDTQPANQVLEAININRIIQE